MKAELSDETRIPLKWIWAIIASFAFTLVSAMSVVMYVGSIVSREDVANAQIADHADKIKDLQMHQDTEIGYWRDVDQRLSRIEGYLRGGKK